MTWWSTLKAKAREWVVRHYPLGGCQSAEENLASVQELVCRAMFVRDGIEEDVCPPHFASFLSDIYFTGHDKKHGSSTSGWPHHGVFLHWAFCTWEPFPRSICMGGAKACCLSCSNCSKCLFVCLAFAHWMLYSYEPPSMSMQSPEFDRTANSNTLPTRRFSRS